MASSGRTLADYAKALDPADGPRVRRLNVVPPRIAAGNGVATALVATPTLVVARA